MRYHSTDSGTWRNLGLSFHTLQRRLPYTIPAFCVFFKWRMWVVLAHASQRLLFSLLLSFFLFPSCEEFCLFWRVCRCRFRRASLFKARRPSFYALRVRPLLARSLRYCTAASSSSGAIRPRVALRVAAFKLRNHFLAGHEPVNARVYTLIPFSASLRLFFFRLRSILYTGCVSGTRHLKPRLIRRRPGRRGFTLRPVFFIVHLFPAHRVCAPPPIKTAAPDLPTASIPALSNAFSASAGP